MTAILQGIAASDAVAITYVPADCGSIIPGKSKAPAAFRSVGLATKLQNAGISWVTEHDALDEPAVYTATHKLSQSGVYDEETNVRVCERVRHAISENLGSNSSPESPQQPPFQLIIGGECGMLPGIMSAFWQRAEPHSRTRRVGLVYIDADTDLSCVTNPGFTGIFAGMNMTHLTGSEGALPSMAQFSRNPSSSSSSSSSSAAAAGGEQQQQQPVCDASNTVMFGLNMFLSSNTREHFAFLFDNNYKVVSAASVAQQPERRAQEALGHFEVNGVDAIVVHLDVDSIDPRLFPLANVPNLTGVTFEQMMRALRVFLSSDKVAGLVVAEVNPDHDPKLELVEALSDHIVEMLAARRK